MQVHDGTGETNQIEIKCLFFEVLRGQWYREIKDTLLSGFSPCMHVIYIDSSFYFSLAVLN